MSYITQQRKAFTSIDQSRSRLHPTTFLDWQAFWLACRTIGIKWEWCTRWIIYHTQAGQTRRDLLHSLNSQRLDLEGACAIVEPSEAPDQTP